MRILSILAGAILALGLPIGGAGPTIAQETARPEAAQLPADKSLQKLIDLGYLSVARAGDAAAVAKAIARIRLRLGSTATGDLTAEERALLEPDDETALLTALADLKTQLQKAETRRKLIASAALDSAVYSSPLSVLWAAIQTFRKAISSTAIGPLSAVELAMLDSEAKIFEDFAGIKEIPYPKRDVKIPLPAGIVGEQEEGDKDLSWLTYRSKDDQIELDYFRNPSSSATALSIATALLEKRKGLNFNQLELGGDEFVIDGSQAAADNQRRLVIMQGQQRDKDIIGHGLRAPAIPKVGTVLPVLKTMQLPTEVLPFKVQAGETLEARNWRIYLKTLNNLIETDFRQANGSEYISTQDCRGVKRDRVRLRKTVNIVYATGRKPAAPPKPTTTAAADKKEDPLATGRFYTSESGDDLSIGCLKVSLVVSGAERSGGQRVGGTRSEATPLDSAGFEVVVPSEPKRINIFDGRHYGFRADERVAPDHTERALLFIHGYNNSFEDAVKRAAQIAAASDYSGFIYVFSWPSQGFFSSYAADMDFAEGSEPELVRFMKMIMSGGTPVTLDVIAHSMGSQIFLRSLDGMRSVFDARLGNDRYDRLRFGQLIFAAPDVAEPVFRRKIAQIRPYADRVTVYASANDGALDISGWVRGDVPRAGAIGASGEPLYADAVHVIDITGELIPRYLIKRYYYRTHSAFAYDPAVLEDIGDILAQSARSARLDPPARARLAARADRFTEFHYKADSIKDNVWWRMAIPAETSLMAKAKEAVEGYIGGKAQK